MRRFLRRLATLPVVLYRRVLSPLKPPTCRFHPTCSAYAEEAILVHGVLKGSLLGAWRLLRCQPFARGGFDPVPPPGAWRGRGNRAVGERPDARDDRGTHGTGL